MTDSRWEKVKKSSTVKGDPVAQNEVAAVLLDLEHFLEIGSTDAQKYDILKYHIQLSLVITFDWHCHWKNLKDADVKWNLGPLYSERANEFIGKLAEQIAATTPNTTIPTLKYDAAASLLAVSKTLRLSSAQSDALTIGSQALAIFLQAPVLSHITDTNLDLPAVLQDTETIENASKYHTVIPTTKGATPHLTDFVNNLGDILRNLGKLELAGDCYKLTLAIRTKQLGDHHADVATSLQLVGNIYRVTGRLEEASEYYYRALAIQEEVFGANHLSVSALLNDLGILQCTQGKLEDGKKTHQRALKIRVESLGPKHPNVANSWNNLGTIFRDQGDFVEGQKCYENALAIRREHFGEGHPHVAFSLTNLGILLQRQGDLEGAAECHRKALAIRTELFGESHPDVVVSLNNLGSVLKQQGKEAEANEHHAKAKTIEGGL